MPKRYMSKEEYAEQQYYYRHSLQSPQDLQNRIDGMDSHRTAEETEKKWAREDLKEKLFEMVREKSSTCLTKRQQEVIELFLLSKKQDYMGAILNVTQEAVHSRLQIALRRLKKACSKDTKILKLLEEIKAL